MYTSTITTKGQATIPSPIRKKLKLKPGEKVVFEERGDEIVIKKNSDVDDLMGSLKTDKKYDKKKIREAVGKMLAGRYLKTLPHETD